MDAGAPGEPGRRAVGAGEVDLHDLSTRSSARVADGDRACQVLARGDRLSAGDERLVRPVRIAKPVAKSEMWLAAGPVVAPVADEQAFAVDEVAPFRVGAEDRRVELLVRHRDRKPSGRLGYTQQCVGQRFATGIFGGNVPARERGQNTPVERTVRRH